MPLQNYRKDSKEGQRRCKTCTKGDNDNNRLGTTASKWQYAAVKKSKSRLRLNQYQIEYFRSDQ